MIFYEPCIQLPERISPLLIRKELSFNAAQMRTLREADSRRPAPGAVPCENCLLSPGNLLYFLIFIRQFQAMHETTKRQKRTLPGAKLRAREQVIAYLETELNREGLTHGARLPTSRALASQLGVSASTVQAVFQELARKGVISTEVGNGSFLINPPRHQSRSLRLGVTFGRLEGNQPSDVWQLGISGAILNHSARMGGDVSVVPIPLGRRDAAKALQTLELYRDRVDGIIMRPIASLYEKLDAPFFQKLPIVHLNPPTPSATANFVSADYLNGWYRMTAALVRSGRKRIVNLVNPCDGQLSAADALRNAGLTAAIGIELGKTVHYEMAATEGHQEEDGFRAAERIFAHPRRRPDAIVTTSDQMACGVKRYCEENAIRVPEEVSIIGGTGSESPSPGGWQITRACQPLEQIGIELVEMLCRIINFDGKPQPGIYLPFTFETGTTTRAAENQLLAGDSL